MGGGGGGGKPPQIRLLMPALKNVIRTNFHEHQNNRL